MKFLSLIEQNLQILNEEPINAQNPAGNVDPIAAAGPETGVVAGDLPALLVARLEALGVDGAGRGAG